MLKKTLAQKVEGGSVNDTPECRTFGDELDDHNRPSEGDPIEDETTLSKYTDIPHMDGSQIAKSEEPSKPVALANVDVIVPQIDKPAEIEDAPASVLEALLAMVASGLRTSRANIDTSQSIKFLAKGDTSI